MRLLSHAGARVVIPTMPYYRPGPTIDPAIVPTSAFNPARVRATNQALADLAAREPTAFETIDLNAFLSPHGKYQDSLDGVQHVRTDGVHFSPAGSDLVGAWLAPQLRTGT